MTFSFLFSKNIDCIIKSITILFISLRKVIISVVSSSTYSEKLKYNVNKRELLRNHFVRALCSLDFKLNRVRHYNSL